MPAGCLAGLISGWAADGSGTQELFTACESRRCSSSHPSALLSSTAKFTSGCIFLFEHGWVTWVTGPDSDSAAVLYIWAPLLQTVTSLNVTFPLHVLESIISLMTKCDMNPDIISKSDLLGPDMFRSMLLSAAAPWTLSFQASICLERHNNKL